MKGVIEVPEPGDDVEDLMDAVGRALNRAAGQDAPRSAPPPAGAEGSLQHRAAMLRHQWRVDTRAIIHSNRPQLGPWLIRFQVLVRRATWWFLEPVVQQIQQYQRSSARVVDELARSDAAMARRLAEIEERLSRIDEPRAADDLAQRDEP